MLWMNDNERYFFEALRAGASGYVLKSVADRDLAEACGATMRGGSFLTRGPSRPSSAIISREPARARLFPTTRWPRANRRS
jgi:DNA-binding NarL/FixJ family response regulator